MWELDHKESWDSKNWCFWPVVLKQTLDSPLDCKMIKPVNPKGNQSWILIGRTDAEAEVLIFSPPDVKNSPTGKTPWCWERLKAGGEGGDRGWDGGWHHWLNGHEFEQALGVGYGQGGLACCGPWVTKSRTWLNDWIELSMVLPTRARPSLSYHQCLPLGNLQKVLSLIHQRAGRSENIYCLIAARMITTSQNVNYNEKADVYVADEGTRWNPKKILKEWI